MTIQINPVKFKMDIKPNDDITEMILSSSKKSIDDGDIIVISQKIISKQEGRVIKLDSVISSELSIGIASAYDKDPKLVEVILSESKRIVRMEHGVIIVETKHGFICANAGIDNSNVEPNIIWKALYKNTLLNSKLEQDFYKINRKWLLQEFHLNPFLAECADRAYEELTGEKIGD